MTDPNPQKFTRIVQSEELRTSFSRHELIPGMPYFVAAEIFSEWKENKNILVPAVGMSQRVVESEGWGRKFDNASINIFMDEYDTDQGTLRLWYQLPTWYRMEVTTRDTFYLYSGGGIVRSRIGCLLDGTTLSLETKLQDVSIADTMYGEVHSVEKPTFRDTTVTYWYLVEVLADSQTISLQPPSYEFYPIERMELDGNRITSFFWRKSP